MSETPAPTATTTAWRSRATYELYASFAILGFSLNGLGAILQPLQADLGVSRARVAFYPTMFAVALLVMGMVGRHLLRRFGEMPVFLAGLLASSTGAALLAVNSPPVTLVGATVVGFGGATMVLIGPILLHTLHRDHAAQAISEQNAVASVVAVFPSWAVAGAIAVGLGWKFGYSLPVALGAGVLFVFSVLDRNRPVPELEVDEESDASIHHPVFGRWLAVLLAVSTEFTFVFWAASALTEWYDLASATGIALASAFLIGMAIGRTGGAPLVARHGNRVMVLSCSGIALVGFVLFWARVHVVVAVVGLLIAGLGVALLYPLTISRLVAARPSTPELTSSYGALASGLALAGAPLVLAQVADLTGMVTAYLLAPLLLAGLVAYTVIAVPGRD